MYTLNKKLMVVLFIGALAISTVQPMQAMMSVFAQPMPANHIGALAIASGVATLIFGHQVMVHWRQMKEHLSLANEPWNPGPDGGYSMDRQDQRDALKSKAQEETRYMQRAGLCSIGTATGTVAAGSFWWRKRAKETKHATKEPIKPQ